MIAHAQETIDSDKFKSQLQQLQQKFEQQQQEMRESFEKMMRAQQAEIDSLKKQVAATTNIASTHQAVADEEVKDLKDQVAAVSEAQKKQRPNEFNPSIGLVGETVFSYRSRGNDQTGSDRPGGFDVFQRSVELNIAASVDPFAKGYAVINASADSETGEATLGVEEAAIQTTSLPYNLELKAGRFFGEFGKLSYIHDHELPFVNRPLALDQYIGGESRTDGAQLNWLLPTSHYISLTTGFGAGFGGDSPLNNPGSYRRLSGFNYFGRLSTYFDLTPNVQLETGVSGLINPTTQDRGGAILQPDGLATFTENERQVAGADLKISWVPLQNNQYKRFDWGSEFLYSHSKFLEAPSGDPTAPDAFQHFVGSLGAYSYMTYKWHRQWSAGFLFDWVQNPMNHSDETFAYSPYITWATSHWNQLRLQYTHTDHDPMSGLRADDAIYLQWAWIIGAHAHGWQQR
ncbi:MAG: hypothetical protein JWO95_1131 [Verrucomicrobiales bacterium]|nr:hypothetical protein [Verrucomicrobiales bacterium]